MTTNHIFIRQLHIEIKQCINRPGILAAFLLIPVLYGLLHTLPQITEIQPVMPLIVADQDNTRLSRKFSRMLDIAQNITVIPAENLVDAKELFHRNKAYAALIIPTGFQRKLLRGNHTAVTLYSDSKPSKSYIRALDMVHDAAGAMGVLVALQPLQATGTLERATPAIGKAPSFYSPASSLAAYVLPAIFLLICHQFIITVISMSTADECIFMRQTFICTPPSTRLGAKLVLYFGLMLAQALLLFALTLPFNIPFKGQFTHALLFLTPFFISVIFLGIILGSYTRLAGYGIFYVVAASIPLLLISGTLWQTTAMPGIVRAFRALLPSSHAMEGFARIFRGASLAEVGQPLASLWVLAAILAALALHRLHHVMPETPPAVIE